MKRIGHAIKIYDFHHKFIARQAFEKPVLLQPLENLFCLAPDLLRRRELCTLFADIDRTHLSCPVIQVRKKEAMDCLVMFKVKVFGFRCTQPFNIASFGANKTNSLLVIMTLEIERAFPKTVLKGEQEWRTFYSEQKKQSTKATHILCLGAFFLT